MFVEPIHNVPLKQHNCSPDNVQLQSPGTQLRDYGAVPTKRGAAVDVSHSCEKKLASHEPLFGVVSREFF